MNFDALDGRVEELRKHRLLGLIVDHHECISAPFRGSGTIPFGDDADNIPFATFEKDYGDADAVAIATDKKADDLIGAAILIVETLRKTILAVKEVDRVTLKFLGGC